MNYKYDEQKILAEIFNYIQGTYSEHYSQDKIQTTEFIIDSGHGMGFCIGNCMKYLQRYRKKGKSQDHRKDLLKSIHYNIIALYVDELENGEKESQSSSS